MSLRVWNNCGQCSHVCLVIAGPCTRLHALHPRGCGIACSALNACSADISILAPWSNTSVIVWKWLSLDRD